MADNMPFTVKEIGELIDEVTTKIPKLIHSLLTSLYSAEAGTNMGKAVGNMYKELINAGIPEKSAIEMTKDYISTLKGITDNVAVQSH
jgi:S-methylmethionine-dependent homocysteine/selenocysteine methylase